MGNRFEDDFTSWLDMALIEDIPTEVEAFCSGSRQPIKTMPVVLSK